MTTPRQPTMAAPTLNECKIRALRLLKDLRSDDPARALRAAERLRILPYFAEEEPEVILQRRGSIQLKHALAAIAAALGYATWTDCKRRLESLTTTRLDTEAFFSRATCGFLNRWFARYEEARASLETEGGYLFPFRQQFFVCEWGFLAALDIDPHDPDWERIGRDWVRPADEAARDRLEQVLVARGYGGQGKG